MERISRIDLFPRRIRLKKPFVISLGRVDYAENVFVRIVTSSGIAGWGECCPFRTINGESLETAVAVGGYLSEALTGRDPLDIGSCIAAMDAAIYGNRSVKSAFDIALHDIAAQSAGVPLYAWLGGSNRPLVTDYTVSLDEPCAMAAEAVELLGAGYPAIKVKVGSDPADDLVRIREIRRVIPREIPLRLDANQGWSPGGAILVLSQLDGMNVEFCEEPIPRHAFMKLPEVRKESAVPLMADESCSDHHDMQRLIDLGACDYVNIKLGKSGGLHTAMKMIRIAESHHLKVQVGGFVESRLAFTASAHLALASPAVAWCDFDTPLMLAEDPVTGGLAYGPGGEVRVGDSPGLGASYGE